MSWLIATVSNVSGARSLTVTPWSLPAWVVAGLGRAVRHAGPERLENLAMDGDGDLFILGMSDDGSESRRGRHD
jgi:hypothetical protein